MQKKEQSSWPTIAKLNGTEIYDSVAQPKAIYWTVRKWRKEPEFSFCNTPGCNLMNYSTIPASISDDIMRIL